MNTRYVEEDKNFTTECDDCFEKTQEEWEQVWNDYHEGPL